MQLQPVTTTTHLAKKGKGEDAYSKEEALIALIVSCIAAGIFLWAIAGFPF